MSIVRGTGPTLDVMMIVVTDCPAMVVVVVVVVVETLATGVGIPGLDDRVVALRTHVGHIRLTILNMTVPRAVV